MEDNPTVDGKNIIQKQSSADELWEVLQLIEEYDLTEEDKEVAEVIARRMIDNEDWSDVKNVADTSVERARQRWI